MLGVHVLLKHFPCSKHDRWFHCTKNSKVGFCLRRSFSSSKSCINILYILSLPIFSSYSVVPLCEVELRVTVERIGSWLRLHLCISTKCLNYGALLYCLQPIYPPISPEKIAQSSKQSTSLKSLQKLFDAQAHFSLSHCTFFPRGPATEEGTGKLLNYKYWSPRMVSYKVTKS